MCVFAWLRAISPYTNKVTFSNGITQKNITNTDHRAEDPVDLSKVYLVSNFPSSFNNDTFQEKARFGANIRIKWVDDTTCVVVLLPNQGATKEKDTENEEMKDSDGGDKGIDARVRSLTDWQIISLADKVGNAQEPVTKKKKTDNE